MPNSPPTHKPQKQKFKTPSLYPTDHSPYDTTWKRLSRLFRDQHPLCALCLEKGIVQAAEAVDHIIPIAVRPDLRLDTTNLRALCFVCHNRCTRNYQQTGRNELPQDEG
jgi:5-methylcytosine-specific restriction endonuclease McrA